LRERLESQRSNKRPDTSALFEPRTERNEDQHQFQESYNYLTNDQPIQVQLTVQKTTSIKEIIDEIASIPQVNVARKLEKTTLILFSSTKEFVRGLFNPECIFSNYNI